MGLPGLDLWLDERILDAGHERDMGSRELGPKGLEGALRLKELIGERERRQNRGTMTLNQPGALPEFANAPIHEGRTGPDVVRIRRRAERVLLTGDPDRDGLPPSRRTHRD
jgi:hypothetical protein